MIELFDGDRREEHRQSSKGNQLKWLKDDIWYKADYTGYEGLAEYVISGLLRFSDLKPEEYVHYLTLILSIPNLSFSIYKLTMCISLKINSISYIPFSILAYTISTVSLQ